MMLTKRNSTRPTGQPHKETMPYIYQNERKVIDPIVEQLAMVIASPGSINYAVTRLIHQHLENKGVRYANLNECIGVLECIKLELYRKIAAPYEDIKLSETGDIGVLPSNG